MKHLIDKAALVAEIDRLQETTMDENRNFLSSYHEGVFDGLSMLENFLDTLEVKEVDLENAVKGRIDYPLIGADFPNIYPNYRELKDYCDKNGIKDEDKVKIIITKTL